MEKAEQTKKERDDNAAKLEKKVFILRTQNRLEIKKLISRLKLQALHPKPLNLDH